MPAAAKKYVVVRRWRRTDRRTGAETRFVPNTPYTGLVEPLLLDPNGPDGKGPLIAEVIDPAPSSASPSDSADDSGKEKK